MGSARSLGDYDSHGYFVRIFHSSNVKALLYKSLCILRPMFFNLANLIYATKTT